MLTSVKKNYIFVLEFPDENKTSRALFISACLKRGIFGLKSNLGKVIYKLLHIIHFLFDLKQCSNKSLCIKSNFFYNGLQKYLKLIYTYYQKL